MIIYSKIENLGRVEDGKVKDGVVRLRRKEARSNRRRESCEVSREFSGRPHSPTGIFLVAFVLLLPVFASAQVGQVRVSGFVRSAEDGEPLPSAIVRVMNSSRGTVCNSEGNYRLFLSPGEYVLVASCLGYLPDTVRLSLTEDVGHDFQLSSSDIVLPEIVVTGEDPARAIIRKAIENKKRWIDKLKSYQMEAFTRQVLRRDTTIASITEAFTKGYWRQGDTLREVSLERRQTENIEKSFNFASVGRILNFYEENIRFLGYSFAGPIADDAFDHYDYKLVRTLQNPGSDLYEIEIKPLSESVPRFAGTISIAGGTYALVGVDVEPNQAFLLPFVKEKHIRYNQQFSQFEQTYWLPADIHIEAKFTIGLPGFSFPIIGFSQTSVITDYQINIPLPDSLFKKPRLVIDSSATGQDSTLWTGPSVLPLTVEEQQAYRTLDSTQTLDVQFRPGGIAMTLGGGGSDATSSILNIIDARFDRAEGFYLGAHYSLDRPLPWFSVRGGIGYGFSDKVTSFTGGVTFFPKADTSLSIGADYYRLLEVIPEQGYYDKLFNSLTSFLVKNDYSDYYRREGWTAFASFAPSKFLYMKLSYLQEDHSAVAINNDYSLFNQSDEYRPNPQADEGNLRSIVLNIGIGSAPIPLDIVSRNRLDFSVEYSSPDFAGSDFRFVRYHAVGTLVIPTFGRRFLAPANLRLRLAAGTSTGYLPRQRIFSLESASSGFAPFGVMKGMGVKEFSGTDYVALNVEHNFRSLPFLVLGIPFLYENNIEFLVHGSVAKSGNSGSPPELPETYGSGTINTTNGWYSEVGFGISRIFELIRCDFTWRLSDPTYFRFTLGVANLL